MSAIACEQDIASCQQAMVGTVGNVQTPSCGVSVGAPSEQDKRVKRSLIKKRARLLAKLSPNPGSPSFESTL